MKLADVEQRASRAAERAAEQLEQTKKEAAADLKAAIMEAELKAAKALAQAQVAAAAEREMLERSHGEEIKNLYEKMSIYQEQIATLRASGSPSS